MKMSKKDEKIFEEMFGELSNSIGGMSGRPKKIKDSDSYSDGRKKKKGIKPSSINAKMKHRPLAKMESVLENYDIDKDVFIEQAIEEKADSMLSSDEIDESIADKLRTLKSANEDGDPSMMRKTLKKFGNDRSSLSGLSGTNKSVLRELVSMAKDRIEMLSAQEMMQMATGKVKEKEKDPFEDYMKKMMSMKMIEMTSGKNQNDSQSNALMMQMMQQQQQQQQQQMVEQFRQQQMQMQQQQQDMMKAFQESVKSLTNKEKSSEMDTFFTGLMKQKEFENKIMLEKEKRMEEKDKAMEERHVRALRDIREEISGRMEKDDFSGQIKDKLMGKVLEKFDPDKILNPDNSEKKSSGWGEFAKVALPVVASVKDDVFDVMRAKAQQPQINVPSFKEANNVSKKMKEHAERQEREEEREELFDEFRDDNDDGAGSGPETGESISSNNNVDDDDFRFGTAAAFD